MLDAVQQLAAGKPYLLVGFSLSGNIIPEMLHCGAEPAGVILIAPTVAGDGFPLENCFQPGANAGVLVVDSADEASIIRSLSQLSGFSSGPKLDLLIQDYLLVKPTFRSTVLKNILRGLKGDEIQFLKDFNREVLIIFGKENSIINTHFLDGSDIRLWQNVIQYLDGVGHYAPLEAPEKTIKLLVDHVKKSFK